MVGTGLESSLVLSALSLASGCGISVAAAAGGGGCAAALTWFDNATCDILRCKPAG